MFLGRAGSKLKARFDPRRTSNIIQLMEKRDWTVPEMVEHTGMHRSTFSYLLKRGIMKGVKRAGRWFVSDDEFKRWLEARKSK